MECKGTVIMQRYELGRLLGQGTFAKVYYGRSLKTNQGVAIKVIDKDKVTRVGLIEQIKREISIMSLVRHPNIVQLYEVMASKTKIYFILEYCKGGELFDKVSKGRLKEEIARKYFHQLIDAIDFCHSRGVYHRDLKPENLLLDENETLKVSDFGLSALAESRRQDGLLHTTCGTPAYVAPEVISRKGYDGAKADIWSCGVILYVLLAGYLPFHDSNLMEMYRKINKGEFKCPNCIPPEVRKLSKRMLDPNPNTRISLTKVKENPWFRAGVPSEPVASEDSEDVEAGPETITPINLNAFDIIALSKGFDLSSLFEDGRSKREAWFILRQPAAVIISKLEEIAERMKFRSRKKEGGVMKFEGLSEGRKGKLSIDAEIFEVCTSFHMLEVKKSSGDTWEYQKILKEDIRPGLEDIVWCPQHENDLLQSIRQDDHPDAFQSHEVQ